VLVRVNISPIQSSLTLSNKTIEIEGLPEGWFVQVAPDNVDVILSGPLPLLILSHRRKSVLSLM